MFELVAKGGQTFPVPRAILEAQSKPLRQATTGPWLESQARRIDLQEWDAETVNQLVSFLYRGTYQGPDTDMLSVVLLEHAKVYALAQYQDIEELRKLALKGIQEGLATNAAKEIYSGAVVELLRYVYSHTQFLTNSKEPLRELVSQFTADNFQNLYTYNMVELIGDGDFIDFRLDVMFKVCERLDNVAKLEGLLKAEKDLLKAEKKEKTAVQGTLVTAQALKSTLTTEIRALRGELQRVKGEVPRNLQSLDS